MKRSLDCTARSARRRSAPFPVPLLVALVVTPVAHGGGEDGFQPKECPRLSVGSELVVRPERTSAEGGAREPGLTVRLRPSLAWEPKADLQLRLTVQGYRPPERFQETRVGVYEAFARWQPQGGPLSLVLGRQELAFGSAFLLGADSFFDGASFDAVKVSLSGLRGSALTLFAGRYVPRWSAGTAGALSGLWAELRVGEGAVDAFFLRDTGGEGPRPPGGAQEQTDSWGLRVQFPWGSRGRLEIEPVRQAGHKTMPGGRRRPIRAYGGHADLTWGWDRGKVRGSLFFSLAWASGDGRPQAGRFTEFHHPNTDTPLVGDMKLVGDLSGVSWVQATGQFARTSGLAVLTVGLATGGSKLRLSAHAHLFRAGKVPPGWAHGLGLEADLTVEVPLSQEVSLVVGTDRFFPTPGLARQVPRARRSYLFGQLVVNPQRLIWRGTSSSG